MCGRFSLSLSPELLAELFALSCLPEITPRFNIAPTQLVAIIRRVDKVPRLDLVRWGLVPSWAKELSIGNKLINARGETLAEKPAFRNAFRHRRCLVPADGFYEWRKTQEKKIPYFVRLADGKPMVFAGLWERWESSDQGMVESCAIVTTGANETMIPIHDRMPVILSPEQQDLWLSDDPPAGNQLAELLSPPPGELLTLCRVNPSVNNVSNDSPACLEPWIDVAPPPTQPSLFDN